MEKRSDFNFKDVLKESIENKGINLFEVDSEEEGATEEESEESETPDREEAEKKKESIFSRLSTGIKKAFSMADKVNDAGGAARADNRFGQYGWKDGKLPSINPPSEGVYITMDGAPVTVDFRDPEDKEGVQDFLKIGTAGAYDNASRQRGIYDAITGYAIVKAYRQQISGAGGDGGGDGGGDDGGPSTEGDDDHIPLRKYPQAREPKVNPETGEAEIDPETGEPKTVRKAPLIAKLGKAGADQHAINTVIRSLVKQFDANNVPWTESNQKALKNTIFLLEREAGIAAAADSIIPSDEEEVSEEKPKEYEYFIDDYNAVLRSPIGPGQTLDKAIFNRKEYKKYAGKAGFKNPKDAAVKKKLIGDFANFLGPFKYEGQFLEEAATRGDDNIDKVFREEAKISLLDKDKLPQLKSAWNKIKSGTGSSAKNGAYIIISSLSNDHLTIGRVFEAILRNIKRKEIEPEEPEEETEEETEEEVEEETPKEKLRFDEVPALFRKFWNKMSKGKLGSADDAWKNLPSGKAGRTRQNVVEAEDSETPRSVDTFGSESSELTKVSWFKLQQDAPNTVSDKDLVLHNFEPLGTGDKERLSKLKGFTGALMNKMKQNVSGRAAAEKGFGDKAYKAGDKKIRLSTMNQQLQTIDPPLEKAARSKILKIVQQHIKPYLKKHGLSLSENQVNKLTRTLVERYSQNENKK